MKNNAKSHAQIYLSQGNLKKALPLLEKITKKKPRDAENWANLGFVYGESGNYLKSEFSLKKSLKLGLSTNYAYQVHRALGNLLEKRSQYKEAITHYTDSIRLHANQLDTYMNLGNCLKHERRIDDAIDAYTHALEIDPTNSKVCCNLGQIYEQSSRLDDARQYTELALKHAPNDTESQYLAAQLDLRDKNYQVAEERLGDLLNSDMPSQHRAMVMKELGRVLDRVGNYSEAFHRLKEANRLFESQYVAHKDESGPVEYRSELKAYRNIFTRELAALWQDEGTFDDNRKIVFLVGFPRSGTTLTEQIIESHPGFIATHEIPVLPRLTRDISVLIGRPFSYPQDMCSLTHDEVNLLRNAYFEHMEKNLNSVIDKDKFLLDKLPLNIVHLGFISRVFPEARILLALRDPRDVCLSCFTQTFSYNQAMRQFLDIDDTVRFYATVMGLWLHYKKVLNINVLETRYEDIVADLEVAAKRIFEFIGVEWHEEALNFYNTAKNRHVFTPSYQSVTQPVYKSAIDKWKNYESELATAIPVLAPYITAFNYSSTEL